MQMQNRDVSYTAALISSVTSPPALSFLSLIHCAYLKPSAHALSACVAELRRTLVARHLSCLVFGMWCNEAKAAARKVLCQAAHRDSSAAASNCSIASQQPCHTGCCTIFLAWLRRDAAG